MPFVQATREVLKVMAGIDSTIGKPYLKQTPYQRADVSGVVNLFGDIIGVVVISMDQMTASKLVKTFCGTDYSSESREFSDAIGEIANMIVGCAKKSLIVKAYMTLPMVVLGRAHHIPPMGAVPCVVIPCSSDQGDFAVEVSIKELDENGV